MPRSHDQKLIDNAARLTKLGISTADVARIVGLTTKAVQRLRDKGRLPRLDRSSIQRGSPEYRNNTALAARARDAEMQSLIDAHNMNQTELARELGVTKQRITILVREGRLTFAKSRVRDK